VMETAGEKAPGNGFDPEPHPAREMSLHLLRMLETRMDAASIALQAETQLIMARLQLRLLAAAATFTLRTIDGLEARRKMRIELAEIGHVRYDLLNADRWVQRLVPILEAQIDTLDLRVSDRASLRPTVERALYRLLDDVKEKIGGNPMIGNLMMGALRPHVPEYAGVVLAELGRPENKAALKKYIKSTLAESAKGTFGNVDMKWRSYILQRYGCADTAACRQEIGERIARADDELQTDYLTVLGTRCGKK